MHHILRLKDPTALDQKFLVVVYTKSLAEWALLFIYSKRLRKSQKVQKTVVHEVVQ